MHQPDPDSAAAELARRLLLTSADLPGFASYDTQFSFASDAVAARCAGVPFEPIAQAHSALYSGRDPSGAELSVVSAVRVLVDAQTAERFFTSYCIPDTFSCIREAAAEQFVNAGVL